MRKRENNLLKNVKSSYGFGSSYPDSFLNSRSDLYESSKVNQFQRHKNSNLGSSITVPSVHKASSLNNQEFLNIIKSK